MRYQVVLPDLTEVGRFFEVYDKLQYYTECNDICVLSDRIPSLKSGIKSIFTKLDECIKTPVAIGVTNRSDATMADAFKASGWTAERFMVNNSEWERGNSSMILWMKVYNKNVDLVDVSDSIVHYANKHERMGYCCGGSVLERHYWKPLRPRNLLSVVRIPHSHLTKLTERMAEHAGFTELAETPHSMYFANGDKIGKGFRFGA